MTYLFYYVVADDIKAFFLIAMFIFRHNGNNTDDVDV